MDKNAVNNYYALRDFPLSTFIIHFVERSLGHAPPESIYSLLLLLLLLLVVVPTLEYVNDLTSVLLRESTC